MSDATTFYILAGVLAGLAVIVSFLGIKVESFPGRAMPAVILLFVVLIGGATTYAVLNGQHEEEVRAAELDEANEAAEEVERQEGPPEPGEEAPSPRGEKTVSGPGGTLKLKASTTELAFDTKSLSSAPGEVTIELDNPAEIPHNVAIEEGGEIVAESETVAAETTSATAPLAAGKYTFLCTVPGHAEAGMEGTLTVE